MGRDQLKGQHTDTTTTVVRWSAQVRGIFENRFVQFLLLGGLLFGVAPASERPDVVSVDRHTLDALAAADTAYGEAARGAGKKEVEQRFIEDEILYREGLRLGFDRDDGIVRQRVVQKVLFLAEEIGGASRPPTEAELRAFHQSNAERFNRPTHIHFRHIFALEQSALPPAPADDRPRGGQVSPIGPEMAADLPEIQQALGQTFAAAVHAVEPDAWSAPIRSAYGWHLVRVLARANARPSTFDEARADVMEHFSVFRRQEAIAAYVSKASSKYRVEIDGQPAPPLQPSRRLAMRSVPSAED